MAEPRKYRKKPVAIEAIQWTRNDARAPIIEFTNNLVTMDDVEDEFFVYDRLHNTWVEFDYGDWIIRGLQGEYYPCKPDIFEATYEVADD